LAGDGYLEDGLAQLLPFEHARKLAWGFVNSPTTLAKKGVIGYTGMTLTATCTAFYAIINKQNWPHFLHHVLIH
jgi:hypothetical protein